MCGSTADIQSATAEIRRGKHERQKKNKPQGKNIMACPIPYVFGHNQSIHESCSCGGRTGSLRAEGSGRSLHTSTAGCGRLSYENERIAAAAAAAALLVVAVSLAPTRLHVCRRPVTTPSSIIAGTITSSGGRGAPRTCCSSTHVTRRLRRVVVSFRRHARAVVERRVGRRRRRADRLRGRRRAAPGRPPATCPRRPRGRLRRRGSVRVRSDRAGRCPQQRRRVRLGLVQRVADDRRVVYVQHRAAQHRPSPTTKPQSLHRYCIPPPTNSCTRLTFSVFFEVETTLLKTPFPQIDIIGAVVIVWRVGGKIIRSVLCSTVCNSCTQ